MFSRLRRSLGARGIFFFCSCLVLILTMMMATNVYYQKALMLKMADSHAQEFVRLVLTAMRHPMLAGDQAVIQKQFDEYKSLPGMDVIHLTDKDGVIRRSSDRNLIGGKPLTPYLEMALRGKEFRGIAIRQRTGKVVINDLYPILNEKGCYPCHGSQDKVLGVVRLALDWEATAKTLKASRDLNILLTVLSVILMSLLVAFFFLKTVVFPIRNLETGMKKAARGDFSHNVAVGTKDEIGTLTVLFNKMTGDLQYSMEKERQKMGEVDSLNRDLKGEINVRKKVELVLHESRQRFEDIINFLPDATFVIDIEGKVIAWNKAMEELSGRKTAEVLGKGDQEYALPFYNERKPMLIDLVIGGPDEDIMKRYSDVKRQEHIITAEAFAPFLNKGHGAYIWSIASPLFGPEGNVIGAIESIRDISGRKAIEAELESKKALLEAQMESSIDGLLVVDDRGNRILTNQRLIEMWEIPASAIADKNDEALLQYVASRIIDPERFIEKVRYLYDHPAETSRDEIAFKDGKFFDRYSSPVIDKNGKYYGRIWSFRDITGRKRAEIALAESEKRFMDVMYASEDAILLIDGNVFVDCNEATARMLGYSNRKEFLMIHPSKLSPAAQPDGRDSFEKAEEMMRIASEKGFNRFEWVHRKADAKDFPVEVSLTPITLHGRNVIYCVWRDMTERKKAEQLLKEVQAQLVQSAKMASVGQLAGGVAHEINNPLVGVLNNVQLIKMALAKNPGIKINDFKEILDDIEAASLRCTDITRSLLDFSHASKGARQKLSVNEMAEKVIGLIELELKLSNIVIHKQFDPGLPLINGEPQLLQQAILDIVSNAKWAIQVKPGNPGGAITVKTWHDTARRSVYLSVSDTGIGIPEENMGRIFEPFFTTKPVGEGTGLGLSLVYNVVREHQGKVEVESVPGRGASFKITLPVVP